MFRYLEFEIGYFVTKSGLTRCPHHFNSHLTNNNQYSANEVWLSRVFRKYGVYSAILFPKTQIRILPSGLELPLNQDKFDCIIELQCSS